MKLREQPSGLRRLAPFAALITLSLLGGCATLLGGNVKGSFACSAPGGTCAPTQVIDDGALGSSTAASAAPASSSEPSFDGAFQRTALGAQAPLRTGERVLRIVFPPRVDRAGRYRESYAVHAVVNRSAWADRRDPANQQAELVPAADLGLAALATSAPALALASSASGDELSASELASSKPLTLSPTVTLQPAALIENAKANVARVLAAQKPAASSATVKKLVSVPASSAQAAPALAPITVGNTLKTSNFPGTLDTGGDR